MEPIVEVTQADREAAAAIVRWQRNATKKWKAQDGDEAWQFFVDGFTRGIMQGIWDQHEVVQSYACHRLASPPTDLKADNAALQAERDKERDAVVAWLDNYACNLRSMKASLLSPEDLAALFHANQHRSAEHG